MIIPQKKNNTPNTYSELLNGKNKRADLRLSLAVISADARNADSAKSRVKQPNEASKPPRRLIPKKPMVAATNTTGDQGPTPHEAGQVTLNTEFIDQERWPLRRRGGQRLGFEPKQLERRS